MSANLDAKESQPWPCPACAFRAPTAPLLAVHVRFVHVDPMFEEEAPSAWRCPFEKCVDEAKVLPNAKRFADHLDRHDLPEKIAEHHRQMKVTHRRAAFTRSEAARRAGKPPSAKRVLHERPRAELLPLDWSQRNYVIGPILGLSSDQVCVLRRLLREEGHVILRARIGHARKTRKIRERPALARRGRPRRRVSKARRGRPPEGMTPTRERYVAAGIGKRPDVEVAEALGVSRQAVEAMRHVLAEMPGFEGRAVKRKKRKRGQVRRLLASRPLAELLALDWSQGNIALAPVLGLTPDDVARLRWVLRNRGHVIPRSPRGRLGAVSRLLATRPIDELLAVDWLQTNIAITTVLSLTENQVAELRAKLREEGHPVPQAKWGGQSRKPPSGA